MQLFVSNNAMIRFPSFLALMSRSTSRVGCITSNTKVTQSDSGSSSIQGGRVRLGEGEVDG